LWNKATENSTRNKLSKTRHAAAKRQVSKQRYLD